MLQFVGVVLCLCGVCVRVGVCVCVRASVTGCSIRVSNAADVIAVFVASISLVDVLFACWTSCYRG